MSTPVPPKGLWFHPKPGTLLMCDYNTGFVAPEMIKKRPVVVISPRPRRSTQLCTVVPLSATAPDPIEPHHHKMDAASLPGPWGKIETWAKCDMLATVALSRLDRIMVGKKPDGTRIYAAPQVTGADLKAIQQAVIAGLGIKP